MTKKRNSFRPSKTNAYAYLRFDPQKRELGQILDEEEHEYDPHAMEHVNHTRLFNVQVRTCC